MRDSVEFLIGKTAACVLLVLLVGCASSPASRFYILSPLSDASEVQRSSVAPCVSIGIGPVRLPEYTNRLQIVTRTSRNELSRAQFDLWAEPLSDAFSRVIADNLSQLRCTKMVYLFPWKASIKPDYRIEADVLELSGDLKAAASLHVQWTIRGAMDEKVLAQRRSNYSEPVGNQSYQGLVEAYSQMVGQFSRDIAKALDEF